jgi:hypothetical protein
MSGTISHTCPHCKAGLSIPAQYAGKLGRCTHCNNPISVPPLASADPPTSAATADTPPVQPSGAVVTSAGGVSRDPRWLTILLASIAVLGIPLAYFLGRESMKNEIRETLFAPFAFAGGTESTPEPPPSREVHAVGEEVTQGGITMIVHSAGPWMDTEQFPRNPSPGHVFIAFEVSITNNTDQRFSANSMGFRVLDGSGREYSRPTLGGPEPGLPLARLYEGETARGWVTMQVPANLTSATLAYQLDSFTGEDIRFKLW